MEYILEDLIDVKLLQELQDKLNAVYSFPSAIIDNDGKVLTAVAWQDICTKFHRQNPESEKECIKSDKYILEHIDEANPAVSYKCPHGMIDNAMPIIIEGKHYGNFFTGQFFLEQPDLEFFKKQATRFGFDEKEYLEAVDKVPVWTREKLNQYLDFIKGFIEIISGIGLKNLKEIESNKQLELANEKLQQENKERKQAETAWNESSQFNKQVINNAQVGIIVYDLNLKYQVWNPFMENLSGIPASEILGKHPMEVFPFLKDVGIIEILEKALKGETVESMDFPFYVASTGKKGWTSDKTSPLRNSNGEIIGAIATVRDITERKKAEEALRESERKNKAWIENSPVCTKIVDLDFNLQFMSESGIRELRIDDINEFYGKPYPFYFYPDSFKIPMRNNLRKAKEKGEIITQEASVNDIEGNKLWYHSIIVPVKNDQGILDYLLVVSMEITKRKEAEEELIKAKELAEENETKFKAIALNTPDHVVILDAELNYTTVVNPQLGLTEADMIGKNDYDILSKDDADKLTAIKREVLKKGVPFNYKTSLVNQKGKNEYFDGTFVPKFNPEGTINGLIGYFRNVTKQKEAEIALFKAKELAEENEKRFNLAMQASNDGLFDWNLLTNEIYYSPSWKKMLGYEDHELPNDLSVWETLTQPDHVKKSWELQHKLITKQIDRFVMEFKMKHKHGHWVDILSRAEAFFNNSGKAVRIVGNHTDITERKKAEELLIENDKRINSLIEKFNISQSQAKIGSWEWDLQTNNIWWSEEVYKIFGVTPSEYKPEFETNGKFLHPDDQKEYASTFANCLETGEELNFDVRLITPSGEIKYCNARGKASYNSNNQPLIFSGVIADITERKLVEEELDKHRNNLEELVKVRTEELERANELLKIAVEKEHELSEMKSRFISTTSHEFRTPLSAILSSTQLLQRFNLKWDNEKRNVYYSKIISSVQYLTILLNDILTLHRTESGMISYSPTNIDLNNFTKACILDIEPLLTTNHEFNYRYKIKRKEFLLDPKLLKNILNNLLSNAVKYSPDGGKVDLVISKDKKYLIIEVSDEGIGIAQEDMTKIFDSFYRTKESEIFAGNGLGLTIVKRAVEIHGGVIMVESELGKGTKFTVRIPVGTDIK